VDIGARRSQVIIGRGHEISFIKPVDLGGQHLHDAVARKLGVTVEEAGALRSRLIQAAENVAADAQSATNGATSAPTRDPVRQAVFDATRSIIEELAREISLCLRYYSVTFRGQRPNRVRLTGGEANDTQLQSILSASLPVPVDVMRPLHSADTSRMNPADRHGLLCEWTTAFGLGLKQLNMYFGARDGKRRDKNAPVTSDDAKGPAAEVVDVARAVETRAVASRTEEAAHA
jgi:type IV pilus assembly protein PilM